MDLAAAGPSTGFSVLDELLVSYVNLYFFSISFLICFILGKASGQKSGSIPWAILAADPSSVISVSSLPKNLEDGDWKDPSKIKQGPLKIMWQFYYDRCISDEIEVPVQFIMAGETSGKGKGKEKELGQNMGEEDLSEQVKNIPSDTDDEDDGRNESKGSSKLPDGCPA